MSPSWPQVSRRQPKVHGRCAVILKCLFCQKEFDDEDKEIMVHVENCLRAQYFEEINQAESTDHTRNSIRNYTVIVM